MNNSDLPVTDAGSREKEPLVSRRAVSHMRLFVMVFADALLILTQARLYTKVNLSDPSAVNSMYGLSFVFFATAVWATISGKGFRGLRAISGIFLGLFVLAHVLVFLDMTVFRPD